MLFRGMWFKFLIFPRPLKATFSVLWEKLMNLSKLILAWTLSSWHSSPLLTTMEMKCQRIYSTCPQWAYQFDACSDEKFCLNSLFSDSFSTRGICRWTSSGLLLSWSLEKPEFLFFCTTCAIFQKVAICFGIMFTVRASKHFLEGCVVRAAFATSGFILPARPSH